MALVSNSTLGFLYGYGPIYVYHATVDTASTLDGIVSWRLVLVAFLHFLCAHYTPYTQRGIILKNTPFATRCPNLGEVRFVAPPPASAV